MEFLGTVFEIGKKMWEAGAKWFEYVNCLDANMQNLKRKIDRLSYQEEDINEELRWEEQHSWKRRKKEVEVWLLDVQKKKDDVRMIEQEVVERRTNVLFRARWGRRIVENIQEVDDLQGKGRFNGLLIDALPTGRLLIPPTKDFLESTKARNTENVLECLMGDGVKRIGVSGMGGAGKTTIMKHIHNLLLKETSKFDCVFWVTVSKASNIIIVQREIAKVLNFSLSDDENETRRASELYELLSQRKRYVLILDDLWEAFPLERVGIPEPTDSNGCKLVLTTRSLEVCRLMDCTIVKVELLTEQEALNLFLSKAVEHDAVLAPEVKEIAIEIAKECACLPLAIVTVAGSLRGLKGTCEWRNALNELICSTKDVSDGEMEVFERLKFSYSRLRGKVLQDCFLYCALYPEDHCIPKEELIEYWIAEGLIAEMDSVQTMFDKGHSILNKLVNSYLLESFSDKNKEECVRMHDLIRDMALRIAASRPRFKVEAGEGLKEVPYEDWSEYIERASLMYNRIELPTRPPVCPRLTTLLLRHKYPALSVILSCFFMHMHRLKVLDLSFNHMQCLPDSISNLENLHALFLENCTQLNSLPSLEKLRALKELKLSRSMIREVPQGIEELVNLRKLDLSHNEILETFPSWKLCRLSELQCLRLDATRVQVSAEDLLGLKKLKVVGVHFHNVQELTRYVTSQQCHGLEKYRLIVGKYRFYYRPLGKEVGINIESELFGSGVDQLVLPTNIDSFELQGCHNVISLSAIPSLRDARCFRTFRVTHCNGIQSIFSSSSFSEGGLIPLITIESLFIHGLPNCRLLFDGFVQPLNISFNLKKLCFRRCPSIQNIFPAQFLHNFPNLEVLEVVHCEHVEEIIVEAQTGDRGNHPDISTITLPKLQKLALHNLPRLKNLYKGMLKCESLQFISVYKCPLTRRLPLSLQLDSEHATTPLALKRIRGGQQWWESLEWDDRRTKTILEPLFSRIRLFRSARRI